MIIMYVTVMEMLWNGDEMFIWSCCCNFIMVLPVIRFLVMVHFVLSQLVILGDTMVFKGQELKRLSVPGEGLYSGAGYTAGGLYSGGGYSGVGSYGLYSGGGYSGVGSYGLYSGGG
eukprot:220220_1